MLTEKGETKNLFDQFGDEHDFRFLATATVSSNSDQLKISPAMANRLTIISVADCAFNEGCFMDMSALLLYHDHPPTILNKQEHSCQEFDILKALEQFFSGIRRGEGLQFSKCLVTLRTLARILLGAHRIYQRFSPTCSLSQAIVTACDMCILQQLQAEQRQVLKSNDGPWEELKTALAYVDGVSKLKPFNFLSDEILGRKDFVLDREKTPERCNYANMVLFAYYTKLPVLLEGPAATGKTSLVEFLGKWLKEEQASILYKTINSESTSVQDYFGTFIPCGDGNFADLRGPLTTAICHGSFFLADEFNLAEPSVLNALFPLLEGRRLICNPVSGEYLTVKDGFLFFATQNNAMYADRKQLPQSLRNRFLQAQVGDFAEGELAFILKHRKFSGKVPFKFSKDTELLEKAAKAIDEAVQRSGVLFGTKSTTKMTIRDLIKWVERYISLGQSKMVDGRPVSLAAAGLTMLAPKLKPMPSVRESVSVILTAMQRAGLADIPDDLQSACCSFSNENPTLNDGVVSLQAQFLGNMRVVSEMNNPEPYMRSFAQLHISLKCHEPVLLIGPTTFKTKLARDYLCGCNKKGLGNVVVVQLSSDTQVGDIVGQIHPFRFHAAVGELIRIAKQLFERLKMHDLNSYTLSTLEEAGELLDVCREKWKNQAGNVETATAAIDLIQMLDEEEMRASEHREAITSELVTPLMENNFSDLASDDDSVEDDLNDDIRQYFGERNDETTSEDSYHMDYNEQLLTADEESVGVAEETAVDKSKNNETAGPPELVISNYTETSKTETKELAISISRNITDNEYVDDDLDDYAPIEYFASDATNFADETLTPGERANKFEFQDDLYKLFRRLESLTVELDDETVSFLLRKYAATLELLRKASTNINRPVFLFRDGSVTRAVKEGRSIIFEDIDLPSQAVVERLNSLFESGRVLYVNEDVSALNDPIQSSSATSHYLGNNGIQMVEDAQILATVHVDNLSESINLSPALRSRFSEILVPQLSLNDIGMVCENRCLNTTALKEYATKVQTAILLVQNELSKRGLAYFTLKEAMTWITMMDGLDRSLRRARAKTTASWIDLFLVAGRLVLLDSVATDKKDLVRTAILNSLEHLVKEFEETKKGTVSKEVRNWIEGVEDYAKEDITDIVEIVNGYIKVKQLPIAAATSQTVSDKLGDDYLRKMFQFTATKTSLDNVTRILATLASDSALLLEGPPGIGKTSIVEQTARLLGFKVERISFTKDTSADVLIGSYIPRADKSTGEMVFTWQDGRVLEAYKCGRFLLLDEINLASQEVLDELKTIVDSTVSQYTVRGLDQTVNRHAEFKVFATMNPTSVGGGRAKLPQSVESIFVKVHLQEYSLEEEAHICVDQFAAKGLVGDDGLKEEDLRNLVQLHRDVKEMVDRKEIGKQGGPYDLNVRDLLKMRDVLYGNIFSLRSHLELHGNERQSKAARRTFVNDNARIAALRTASDLVYSKRFLSLDDQRKVMKVVDKLFPAVGIANNIVHDVTIDMKLPNSVRIGFMYLTKGHEQSPFAPLLPTTTLNQQLQVLASAVVSGRVVFLQGPTCSRKTSLVCELSRLCCRKLHVIPLSEDTDTDSLIGHWTPRRVFNSSILSIDKCCSTFSKCLNCLLSLGLLSTSTNDVRVELLRYVAKAMKQFEEVRSENAAVLINAFTTLWKAYQHLVETYEMKKEEATFASVRNYMIREQTFINSTVQVLKQLISTSTAKNTGFEFVESTLVQAVRKGDWVLLDNLSAASSDVIERILSLAESPSKLHLFESPQNETLSTGNGISSGFQLFATVNPTRHTQTQLSSAFLNRVIIVQLPQVDNDALAKFQRSREASLIDTELYKIVVSQMQSVPACQALARTLVKIHCELRDRWFRGNLKTVGGVQITFRTVLRTSQEIAHMNRLGVKPVKAMARAVGQHYIKCIKLEGQFDVLGLLGQQLDLKHTEEDLQQLPQRDDSWLVESQARVLTLLPNIQTTLANLVRFVLECLCYFLKALLKDKTRNKDVLSAINAISKTTDNLLTHISDNNELNGCLAMIRSRCHLVKSKEQRHAFSELVDAVEQYVKTYGETSVSRLSYNAKDASELASAAESVRATLLAMGSEIETCILNSSFEDALHNLNIAEDVVSIMRLAQETIDQHAWLSEYSLQLSERNRETAAIQTGLDSVRNAISVCYQHAAVVDGVKKPLQLLNVAIGNLKRNFGGHATESATILTTIHRILQERITDNCDRDRLLEFLNDYKLLPTQNVAQLKLLLYAIEMLFVSSSSVPLALRELSDVESTDLVEKLKDLSLLECGIDICERFQSLLSDRLVPVLNKRSSIHSAQRTLNSNVMLRADDDNVSSDEIAVERDQHILEEMQLAYEVQRTSFLESDDTQFVRMWYSEAIRKIHCSIFRILATEKLPIDTDSDKFLKLFLQLKPIELKRSLGPLWIVVFSELHDFIWSSTTSSWDVFLISSDADFKTELPKRSLHEALVFVAEEEEDNRYSFGVVISNKANNMVYVISSERRIKASRSNKLLDRVVRTFQAHNSRGSNPVQVIDIQVCTERAQLNYETSLLPVIALKGFCFRSPVLEIWFGQEDVTGLERRLSGYCQNLLAVLRRSTSEVTVRHHVLQVVNVVSDLNKGFSGNFLSTSVANKNTVRHCESLRSQVVKVKKDLKQELDCFVSSLIPRDVQKCFQFLRKVDLAISTHLACSSRSDLVKERLPKDLRLLEMLQMRGKQNRNSKELAQWGLVWDVVRKMFDAVKTLVNEVFLTIDSQSGKCRVSESAFTDLQSSLVIGDCKDALSYICAKYQKLQYHFFNAMKSICKLGKEGCDVPSNKPFRAHLRQALSAVESLAEFLHITGQDQPSKMRETCLGLTEAVNACLNPTLEEKTSDYVELHQKIMEKDLERFIAKLTDMHCEVRDIVVTSSIGSPLLLPMMLDMRKFERILVAIRQGQHNPDIHSIEKPIFLDSLIQNYRKEIDTLLKSQRTDNDRPSPLVSKEQKKLRDITELPTTATLTSNDCESAEALGELQDTCRKTLVLCETEDFVDIQEMDRKLTDLVSFWFSQSCWEKIYIVSKELHDQVMNYVEDDKAKAVMEKQVLIAHMISDVGKQREHSSIVRKLLSRTSLSSSDTKDIVSSVLRTLLGNRWHFCCSVNSYCKEGLFGFRSLRDVCSSVARNPLVQQRLKLVNATQILDICLSRGDLLRSQQGVFDDDTVTRLRPYSVTMTDLHFLLTDDDSEGCQYLLNCEMELEKEHFVLDSCDLTNSPYLLKESEEVEFGMVRPITILLDELSNEKQCWIGQLREFHFESLRLFINTLHQFFQAQDVPVADVIRWSYRSLSELPEYSLLVATTGVSSCLWILQNVLTKLLDNDKKDLSSLFLLREDNDLVTKTKQRLDMEIGVGNKQTHNFFTAQREPHLAFATDHTVRQDFEVDGDDAAMEVKRLLPDRIQVARCMNIRSALRDISNYLTAFKEIFSKVLVDLCQAYDSATKVDLDARGMDTDCLSNNFALTGVLLKNALKYTHVRRAYHDGLKETSQVQRASSNSDAAAVQQAVSKVNECCYKMFSREAESPNFCKKFQTSIQLLACCIQSLCASIDDIELKKEGLTRYHSGKVLEEHCFTATNFGDSVKEVFYELSQQCSQSVADSLVVMNKGQVALKLAVELREKASAVRTDCSALGGHYSYCSSLMLKLVAIVLLVVERRQKGSSDIDELRWCLQRHDPMIADKYSGKELKAEFQIMCNEIRSAEQQLHRPLEILLLDFVGDPFVVASADAYTAEWLQRDVCDICLVGESIGKNLKWFMSIPDVRKRELQLVESSLSILASVMQQKLDVLNDSYAIETKGLKNGYKLLGIIHHLFIELKDRNNVQTSWNVLMANVTLLVRQMHSSTLDARLSQLKQSFFSTDIVENDSTLLIMHLLDSAYTSYQNMTSSETSEQSVDVMHLVTSFLFETILTTGRVLLKDVNELSHFHDLAFDFSLFLEQFVKICNRFEVMLKWPVPTINVTETLGQSVEPHVVMTETRVKDAVCEISAFLLKYDSLIWTMMKNAVVSWLREVTTRKSTEAKMFISIERRLRDLEVTWTKHLARIESCVATDHGKLKGTNFLQRALTWLQNSLLSRRSDDQEELESYLKLRKQIEGELTSACRKVKELLDFHPDKSDKIYADVVKQLLFAVEKYNDEVSAKEGDRADLFYIEEFEVVLRMVDLHITGKATSVSLCLGHEQKLPQTSLPYVSQQQSICVTLEELPSVLLVIVGEEHCFVMNQDVIDIIKNVATPKHDRFFLKLSREGGKKDIVSTLSCEYEFCLERTFAATSNHPNDCYTDCSQQAKDTTSLAHTTIHTADWSNFSRVRKIIGSESDNLYRVEKHTLDNWDVNRTAGGGARTCIDSLFKKASVAITNATRMVSDLQSQPFSQIEEYCIKLLDLLPANIEDDIRTSRLHLNILTKYRVPQIPSYFPSGTLPETLTACLTSLKEVCREALVLATADLCTARNVQLGLMLVAILSGKSDENDHFRKLESICERLESSKWLNELRNHDTFLQSSAVLFEGLTTLASYLLRKRISCSKLCEKFAMFRAPELVSRELSNHLISLSRREPALHFFQDGSGLKPLINLFSLNISSVVSETWNPTATLTLFNHSKSFNAQFKCESKTNNSSFCVNPVSGEIKPNSSSQVQVFFDQNQFAAKRNCAIQASGWFAISIRSQPCYRNDFSYVEAQSAQVIAFIVGDLQPIDSCLHVSPLYIDFGAMAAGRGGGGTHTKFAVVRNNSDHNVIVVAKLENTDTESAKLVCKIGTDKIRTLKPNEDFSWSIKPLSLTGVTIDCVPFAKPGKVDAKLTFTFPFGKVIKTPIRGAVVNPQLTLSVDGIQKLIKEPTKGNNSIQFFIDQQKTQEIIRVENSGLIPCEVQQIFNHRPYHPYQISATFVSLLPRTSVLLKFEKSSLPIRYHCGGILCLFKPTRTSSSLISCSNNGVTTVSLAEKRKEPRWWSINEIEGNPVKLLQIPIKIPLHWDGSGKCFANISCSNSCVDLQSHHVRFSRQKRKQDITCLYFPGVTTGDSFDLDINYETDSMAELRKNDSVSHTVRISGTLQTEFTFRLQDSKKLSKHFHCEQLLNEKMRDVEIGLRVVGCEDFGKSLNYKVSLKSVNCSSKWQGSHMKESHECSDWLSEKLEKEGTKKVRITKEITEDYGVCGCEIQLECPDSFTVWGGEAVAFSTKLYCFDSNGMEREQQEYRLDKEKQVELTEMVTNALCFMQEEKSFRVAATAVAKAIICQEDSNTCDIEADTIVNTTSPLVDAADTENVTLMSGILVASKYGILEGSVLKACRHGLFGCKLATMCRLNSIKLNLPDCRDLIDAIIECLIMPQAEAWPYHWRDLHINLKALICLIDSVKSNSKSKEQLNSVSIFLEEIINSCKQLPCQYIECNHVRALLNVTSVLWCGDCNETSVHGIPQAASRLCVEQPRTLKQFFQALKPAIGAENSSCTIFEALELAAQPCNVSTVCTYFKKSALKAMTVSSTTNCISTILDSISKAISCCPLECPKVDSLLELLRELLSTGSDVAVSTEVMAITYDFYDLLLAQATIDRMSGVLQRLLNAAMFDDTTSVCGKLLQALKKICIYTDGKRRTQMEGVADVISLYLEGKCGHDSPCVTAFALVKKLALTSTNARSGTLKLKTELTELVDLEDIELRNLLALARTIAGSNTMSVYTALFVVAEILAKLFTDNFAHQLADLKLCLEKVILQPKLGFIYRLPAAFNIAQIIYAAFCKSAPLTSRIGKRLKNLTKCFNRIIGDVGHERLETSSSEFDATCEGGHVTAYSSRWSFPFDFFHLARHVFLLIVSKQRVNKTTLQDSYRFILAANFPSLVANCFACPLSTLSDCLADVVVQVCGMEHKYNLRKVATHIRRVVKYQWKLRHQLLKNLLACDLQISSSSETLTADLEATLMILSRFASPTLATKLQCFKNEDSTTTCQLVKTALSTVEWYDNSLSSYFRFVGLLNGENEKFEVKVLSKLDNLLALRRACFPAERARRARSDCRHILTILAEILSKDFKEPLNHLEFILSKEASDGSLSSATNVVKRVFKMVDTIAKRDFWNDVILLFETLGKQTKTSVRESIFRIWEEQRKADSQFGSLSQDFWQKLDWQYNDIKGSSDDTTLSSWKHLYLFIKEVEKLSIDTHTCSHLKTILNRVCSNSVTTHADFRQLISVIACVQQFVHPANFAVGQFLTKVQFVLETVALIDDSWMKNLEVLIDESKVFESICRIVEDVAIEERFQFSRVLQSCTQLAINENLVSNTELQQKLNSVYTNIVDVFLHPLCGDADVKRLSDSVLNLLEETVNMQLKPGEERQSFRILSLLLNAVRTCWKFESCNGEDQWKGKMYGISTALLVTLTKLAAVVITKEDPFTTDSVEDNAVCVEYAATSRLSSSSSLEIAPLTDTPFDEDETDGAQIAVEDTHGLNALDIRDNGDGYTSEGSETMFDDENVDFKFSVASSNEADEQLNQETGSSSRYLLQKQLYNDAESEFVVIEDSILNFPDLDVKVRCYVLSDVELF